MPSRIQRKRTKGWRMPHGAVYVGRPSKWGNQHRPYACCYCPQPSEPSPCDAWFTRRGGKGRGPRQIREERQRAVDLFRDDLVGGRLTITVEDVRRELANRDLCCWCPLPAEGEPDLCHAAVLLETARLPLYHPDQCPNEGGCGWEPGKTFICAECGHEYCWCQGCGDDLPEFCDYCWQQIHHATDSSGVMRVQAGAKGRQDRGHPPPSSDSEDKNGITGSKRRTR